MVKTTPITSVPKRKDAKSDAVGPCESLKPPFALYRRFSDGNWKETTKATESAALDPSFAATNAHQAAITKASAIRDGGQSGLMPQNAL